jgi:hypothetical protein
MMQLVNYFSNYSNAVKKLPLKKENTKLVS